MVSNTCIWNKLSGSCYCHYMSLVKGKKLTVPIAIYLHYVSPLKGPCDADTYVLGGQ